MAVLPTPGSPMSTGIVLGLAGKDADHVADFRVAADHRVQLLGPRQGDQVLAVLLQGVVGGFRVVRGDAGVAAHALQRGQKAFLLHAVAPEQLGHRLVRPLDQAKGQVLDGGVFVLHLLGVLFGLVEGRVHLAGNVYLVRLAAGAADAGQLRHRPLHVLGQGLGVHAHLHQQLGQQALLLLQ